MTYTTRIISLIVAPVTEPIFSEQATTVQIADEASGEFVEVIQSGREGLGKIQITAEEWPVLRDAINQLMAECRE